MNIFYENLADVKDSLNIFIHDTTSIGAHFHSSIEFVYNLEGKTDFLINGTHYILGPDDIYTVPGWTIHSNSSIGKNRICSIVFSDSFFSSFEQDYPSMFFPPVLTDRQNNRKLLPLINDYIDCWMKHEYITTRIKKQAFINTFLYELTELYTLRPIIEQKTNHLFVNVLSYINKHYMQPLTLESLAKQFYYSAPHFSTLFNKHVGMSLNSYINSIRTQKVQELISDPKNDQSVITVALNCGFNSPASFYRALKKYKINKQKTE